MTSASSMCGLTAAVVFTAIGIALSASAEATQRLVPADYPTIQAAIDVSESGDEVIMAIGTYTGTGNNAVLTWIILDGLGQGPHARHLRDGGDPP